MTSCVHVLASTQTMTASQTIFEYKQPTNTAICAFCGVTITWKHMTWRLLSSQHLTNLQINRQFELATLFKINKSWLDWLVYASKSRLSPSWTTCRECSSTYREGPVLDYVDFSGSNVIDNKWCTGTTLPSPQPFHTSQSQADSLPCGFCVLTSQQASALCVGKVFNRRNRHF
jgi:hypothetical protein